MAARSSPWGEERGSLSQRMRARDQVLSRRQARRLNRRFAGVGVEIPAARLQDIAAGATAGDRELVDVEFALVATEIQRQQRAAKFRRGRRRGMRWLIVAGLVLVVLHSLLCMAYVFFLLTQHTSPI